VPKDTYTTLHSISGTETGHGKGDREIDDTSNVGEPVDLGERDVERGGSLDDGLAS
jgi:hypothetical protein